MHGHHAAAPGGVHWTRGACGRSGTGGPPLAAAVVRPAAVGHRRRPGRLWWGPGASWRSGLLYPRRAARNPGGGGGGPPEHRRPGGGWVDLGAVPLDERGFEGCPETGVVTGGE